MPDDPLKVYKATVIDDNPFPGQVEEELDTSQKTSNQEYTNTAIKPQRISKGVTASNVVSNSLNTISRKITNSYSFTQSGAIQIGNYKDGTSGDIRISPDGITARDSTGETTFALDGTTGDATFKGTIVAGSLLLDTFIQIGSGTSVFKADDQGIYLGNETFALAPFRVNLTGDVTASSLTLTNASVGAGSAYTGNPIGNLYLDSISATKITAGTLNSGVINTGTLNADNMTTGTLNASVINVTNLNADNINTGTLVDRTVESTSGINRIVLSNGDNLSFYNGGVETGRIRPATAGLGMVATIGSFVTKANEGFFGSIATGSYTDFFKFYGDDNVGGSPAGVIEAPTSNRVFLIESGGSTLQTWSTSEIFFNKPINWYDSRLNSGRSRYVFQDTSGNEQFSIRPDGGGNTRIAMNGYELRLTSNKTAIVPTSKGFNALYSAEAPEVWFFDFCDDKDSVDPLFLEVTSGRMKFIKLDGGGYQVWRRRKGHEDLRFEAKTAQEFEKNEEFLRMSKL